MKLTPASSAAWMMRIDSSWSGLPQEPNIMAPRHSSLTETPVRPRTCRRTSGPRGRRLERRRPAAEQPQGLLVAGAGMGGVGEDGQAHVGREVQALEVEAEVAHDRMVEVLDAVEVEADVVRGPVGAERLALGGELADEVRQGAVLWVAAGGGAQHGDRVAGGAVPVEVEVAGAGIEE